MVTRLQVSGFKNLIDVDVHFGPFTCIAGANGVGKSNLFDAIRFLGALGDKPINEAAGLVRNEAGGGDLRSLFTKVGTTHRSQMRFVADLIIPAEGVDDLRQTARAAATYLRYEIRLGFREATALLPQRIVLEYEQLVPLHLKELSRQLAFSFSEDWRKSVIVPKRGTIRPLIATESRDTGIIIKRHQEQKGGKPREFFAEDIPRTVLSSTSAVEGPTALLVRTELRAWRLLQLEPAALRKPSRFRDANRLGSDGANLPATLRRLVHAETDGESGAALQQLTNRINDLLRNVQGIQLITDERRESYAIQLTDRAGTTLDAASLSDGTLRFLALATLAIDPIEAGVICLEEPENGIHPERIAAMIDLLGDIAVDTDYPIGPDNPPRQVIVNTHAPAVVQQVAFEQLLLAQPTVHQEGYTGVAYLPPPESLREQLGRRAAPLSSLLPYLNPVIIDTNSDEDTFPGGRVIDHVTVRQLSLFQTARP